MSGKKIAYKWWWGWEPDALENWLEEMELKGWRLNSASLGGIRFEFIRGEPRRMRYGVDYQERVETEYYNLYSDLGWKLAYSWGPWYIWAMAYQDERPQIYTDLTSRMELNNRLRGLMISLMAAMFPLLVVNLHNFDYRMPVVVFLFMMYLLLYGMITYGLFKLSRVNKALKKGSVQ
ncbi:MAG: DUF2812 domain-containing protein [Methylocystaceae bacterium]